MTFWGKGCKYESYEKVIIYFCINGGFCRLFGR